MTEVQQTADKGGRVDGLRARAILTPDDIHRYSYHRVEDPRSALARGLEDWLGQISLNWAGGRLLRFKEVVVMWEDPEAPASYPSLAIVGAEEGSYEAAAMTPTLIHLTKERGDGSGRFLKAASELRQEFQLIVWSTDKLERSGLTAALEDMLEPSRYMTGLRLELPYYFNARATYEKLGVDYSDASEDGQRRWRRSMIRVAANIEQLVPVGDLPFGKTRLVGEVYGSEPSGPPLIDPPTNIEGVVIQDRSV